MPDTEKRRHSSPWPYLVALVAILCAVGTYMILGNRTQPTLFVADGRLLYDGEVMASYPTQEKTKVKEGMKAKVAVEGYTKKKFSGLVKLVHEDGKETIVILRLAEVPGGVRPPVPCQVTIDLWGGASEND